jgi:hypothetical protein
MELEQARVADKNEIEMLKAKLEQAQLVVRDGQAQVSQQRNLIEQLQDRVEITESIEIDIGIFKSQASEIRNKIFLAQQNLLTRIGEIRENCLLVNQVSKNLIVREREAEVARVIF